jgi:hypothetical protein
LRKDQPIKCSDFAFFKYLGFVLWGPVIHIKKVLGAGFYAKLHTNTIFGWISPDK